MPDYGHELMFGTFLRARANDVPRFLRLVDLTEETGLDAVTVPDHPYHVVPGLPDEGPQLDTLTALAMIAHRTSRVRLVPNVVNLPLRPPVMLARATATIDVLSGGRFELALGAGAMWDQITREGGPRRTPAESVAAMEESIRVIRLLWTSGASVSSDGPLFRLDKVYPGPSPAHRMGIWLGVYRPRMLRLVGSLADGWVSSQLGFPPHQFNSANAIIDEAATLEGRDPRAVRRVYNILGDFQGTGGGFLQGPPKVWVEQLTELTLTEGVSGYNLFLTEDPDTIRQFAAEVAPAVRDAVAAGRA